MSNSARPVIPVVFGCGGLRLNDEEAEFFAKSNPFGLILFARNCDNPDQVCALIEDFRQAARRPDAAVLIDQEGGRVQRLRPPHWRDIPAPARFGELASAAGLDAGYRAASANARLIGAELRALGITVNCLPCLDLPGPASHDVIGDRALSDDPTVAAMLGSAVIDGLLSSGILPVIKHLPGHGRATSDSHDMLPEVSATKDDLAQHDLTPFIACRDAPLAMTAHIRYLAIDPDRPATQSAIVINEIIRGHIGFAGLLFSDDLCMSALSGDAGERAARALAAGCDVVLHCNGVLAEMATLCQRVDAMSDAAQARWQAACDLVVGDADLPDLDGLQAELDAML